MTRSRVLVIGGGISGLTAAYRLGRLAPQIEVVVLDAGNRPGGTAASEMRDGVVLDHGANGFLDNVPATLALIDEVGLSGELVRSSPAAKRRFLFKDNALQLLPTGPGALLTTPLMPLSGRLRVLREPFVHTPAPPEESVYDFAARRFGRDAADVLAAPFVTGISAGDARVTSMQALFPKVAGLEREHGSVVKGMIASRKAARAAGSKPAPTQLATLRGGLGRLTDRLAHALGPSYVPGSRVTQLERAAPGVWRATTSDGRSFDAERVVFATPAYVVSQLVREFSVEAAAHAAAIHYASVRVVTLAWPAPPAPGVGDAFGFLATPGCGLRLKGCIYVSSIFPGHAPEGWFVARNIVGGTDDPTAVERTEAEIEQDVLHDLRVALGVTADPVLRWHRVWPRTIPQYAFGHRDRVSAAEFALASQGVFVTGNAWRGISYNDCIVDAESIAAKTVKSLGR